MATLFRQYLLLLAVLLTAFGNMGALSFCECSSGIFIGSCACQQEQTQAVDSLDHCGDCDVPHQSSMVFIGSHHCHHVSLISDDQAQITPPLSAQVVPSPQFIVPSGFFVSQDLIPSLPFVRELYDPPDPPLLLKSGGIGYRRPLLI